MVKEADAAEKNAVMAGVSDQAADESRKALSREAISDAAGDTRSGTGAAGSDNLPDLTIHDSGKDGRLRPGDADASAKPSDKADSAAAGARTRSNWTVVVDLTTDLNADGTAGAQRQIKEMARLKEESKGHPDVTIVVQVPEKTAIHEPGPGEAQPRLDRYIIRNGEMTRVQAGIESQGMAANLETLLKFATKNAPSEHIALASKSHGAGPQGLVGGTGHETIAEMMTAIKSGLSGSGHVRLDILDFDACVMSSAAALAAVHSIADHVIASEEPEANGKSFDGQNLTAVLSDLLKHPGMSPPELAGAFVSKANQDAVPESEPKDKLPHVGADTLASYDSSKYKQFSDALNELGTLLSGAAQDGKARKAIADTIDHTSRLPLEPSLQMGPDLGDRDLKEFVSGLERAAGAGTLPDEGGKIARAARRVLDTLAGMTEAFQSSASGGFDKLGGLYTFLPVLDIRDERSAAGQASPLQALKLFSSDEVKFADKGQFVGTLEQITGEISEKLSASGKKCFAPVLDACTRVAHASNDAEFQAAAREMRATVAGLKDTAVERELLDNALVSLKKFRPGLVSGRDIPGSEKWNGFIHEMSGVF